MLTWVIDRVSYSSVDTFMILQLAFKYLSSFLGIASNLEESMNFQRIKFGCVEYSSVDSTYVIEKRSVFFVDVLLTDALVSNIHVGSIPSCLHTDGIQSLFVQNLF